MSHSNIDKVLAHNLLDLQLPSRSVVRGLTSCSHQSHWSYTLLTEYFDRKYSHGDRPDGAILDGQVNCVSLQQLLQLIKKSRKHELLCKVLAIVLFVIILLMMSKAEGMLQGAVSLLALCVLGTFSYCSWKASNDFKSKRKSCFEEIQIACYHLLILYSFVHGNTGIVTWHRWKNVENQGMQVKMFRDPRLKDLIYETMVYLESLTMFGRYVLSEHPSYVFAIYSRSESIVNTLAVVLKRFGLVDQFEAEEAKRVKLEASDALQKLSERVSRVVHKTPQEYLKEAADDFVGVRT